MKAKFLVNERVQQRFNKMFGNKYNYIDFGNDVVDIALSLANEEGFTKLDIYDNIAHVFYQLDSPVEMDTAQTIFVMQEIISIITRIEEID